MAEKDNQIILDSNLVEQFLIEREKAIAVSGAIIMELDKKTEILKREVEETNRKLMFLL